MRLFPSNKDPRHCAGRLSSTSPYVQRGLSLLHCYNSDRSQVLLIWLFLKVDVVNKCDGFFFFLFLNGVFISLDIISNSQAAS